jgi:hypothetical protein
MFSMPPVILHGKDATVFVKSLNKAGVIRMREGSLRVKDWGLE